ncbi:MAG: TraB/GumN family protein [Flavobacteriales bacterium]
MNIRVITTLALFLCLVQQAFAQKKYQSLMWEIKAPGSDKPSYLYGTMHVSGKMVFHLGDQFYRAIEAVDVVALELEPEAWLQAIFDDKDGRFYRNSSGGWDYDYGWGGDYDSSIPNLRDNFKVHSDISETVQGALMYDPSLLNYMLFRYDNYGYSADFEEDTWLDMYIYQTGKKMGKETLGLETYEQSDSFLKLARKAERNNKKNKKKSLDEGDRKELEALSDQLEPAYRKQDLDLIDSLNKKTTSEAFDKYILVERNKVFVQQMDSVMRSGRTMFAGMGCAHLPGDSGVIEMLRTIGYTITPYNKGERNAKRREKLENTIFKRNYTNYTTHDGELTFSAPSAVYDLGAGNNGTSWICLDIPNGSSFIVYRMKTHAGLRGLTDKDILASIDSILYEAVAGDIVSQKKITVQGYNGLDIVNKTRRGDYQRKQLIILPEEILLLKLSATGEKVKAGYGNEFFNSLSINLAKNEKVTPWQSQDGSIHVEIPGHIAYYERKLDQPTTSDFELNAHDATNNDYFVAQRYTIADPDFMDEDEYEANRLADAYQEDNNLKEAWRKYQLHQGFPAVLAKSTGYNDRTVYNLFVIQGLNYCAFSAMTTDSLRAMNYLHSVKFRLPQYSNWQEFADTTNHFRVQLPYEQLQEGGDDYYSWDWYGGDEDEKNEMEGAEGSIYLSPHGSPDVVEVQWWLMDQFSWSNDSMKYAQQAEDNFVKDHKFNVVKKNLQWNPNGFELDLVVNDTSCTRMSQRKVMQYNQNYYLLTTSYDSLLGPSEFVTKLFDSFTPADTTFAVNHFRNRNKTFLENVFSTDSTTQANAVGICGSVFFCKDDMPLVRESLHRIDELTKDEYKKTVRSELTAALDEDTTDVNIAWINKEYYLWSDSANYQVELLNQLLQMQTKTSYSAYKKLILDEPPIPAPGKYDSYSSNSFGIVDDTLKLCAALFPEMMQLKTLNEYEKDIIDLIATLVDSSLMKKNIYEKDLGTLVLEAKNELKRLNSSDEDNYNFNTTAFYNYMSLLQPYRDRPEVKALFAKAYNSKKTRLLKSVAMFDLRHDVPVPDSIFKKIVTNEKRIIPLYNSMQEEKKAAQFPAEYASREKLAEVYIKNKFADKYEKEKGKVDSVMQIQTSEKMIRGKAFDVYYYKYKSKNSDQWKGLIFAFDKQDTTSIWPRFIERTVTIVLDEDEDEVEELDKEWKRLVESNRRSFRYTDGESTSYNSWY